MSTWTDLSSNTLVFEKKWPVIEVSGKDRVDFLHRVSSQDFRNAKEGSFVPGAFLHGSGTVIGLFQALVRKQEIRLLVEPHIAAPLLNHMERLHFREDLKIQLKENPGFFWEVLGEDAAELVQEATKLPRSFIATLPQWNGPAFFVAIEEAIRADLFRNRIEDGEIRTLTPVEYDTLRALNAIPKDGVDVGNETILLEAGLTGHFHSNKGCYPGQEVIEKIQTYGRVPRRLVSFRFQPEGPVPAAGSALISGDDKVGMMTSAHALPDGGMVGVGYVLRARLEKGAALQSAHGTTLQILRTAGV